MPCSLRLRLRGGAGDGVTIDGGGDNGEVRAGVGEGDEPPSTTGGMSAHPGPPLPLPAAEGSAGAGARTAPSAAEVWACQERFDRWAACYNERSGHAGRSGRMIQEVLQRKKYVENELVRNLRVRARDSPNANVRKIDVPPPNIAGFWASANCGRHFDVRTIRGRWIAPSAQRDERARQSGL